jgi:hypothetical protein
LNWLWNWKKHNTYYKKADKVIGLDFLQEMLNKAKRELRRTSGFQKQITVDWNVENDYADLTF